MSVNFNALCSPTLRVVQPGEVFSLPSNAQAQRTFWGLGDRFWMQIIDGKFHTCGPQVFDQGLHHGPEEPGFFESLKKGCEFASEHLGEKLTVQFYKDLHKKLCAHFKGSENNTEIAADKTGIFRQNDVKSEFSIKEVSEQSRQSYFFAEIYKSSISENHAMLVTLKDKEYHRICKEWFEESILGTKMNLVWLQKWKAECKAKVNISQVIDHRYPLSKKWVEQWESKCDQKVLALNKYIAETCSSMGINCLVSISRINGILLINYDGTGLSEFEKLQLDIFGEGFKISEEMERIVQILFDRYNQKIDAINQNLGKVFTKDQMKEFIQEKVKAIAELYQWLEWLHPFPDGQGRTDLVFQAMLLCQQGSNPAILEQPYFSSYSLPSESAEYLLSGIEDWARQQNPFQ